MDVVNNIQLGKYSAYKDSGEEWLGEVPKHWTVGRLRVWFEERRTKVSDKLFAPLSVTKNGILPQLDSAAKSNDGDNRKLVLEGDFVINSRSDRKGSSGIAFQDGSVSLINIVLKPKEIDRVFSNYLLKSNEFIEEYYRNGYGIVADLWTTRYDEMKNIKIAIPPLSEQISIATFLDEKTVKTDQAIAQKERLIELLKERKQILIQELVTGKKVWDETTQSWTKPKETIDSGLEWIGGIPKGWEVKRLKYLLSELNIRSQTGKEELLSLSKYNGVIPKSELEERAGGAESLIGYKLVKENHLVINKMQAINGLIAVSKISGITSPDYSVYFSKNEEELKIDFLCHLILQPQYLAEFKRRVRGVMEGFIRLYTDDLYDVPISLPTLSHQEIIVKEIEAQTLKINNVISVYEQQIVKLKEYKTVLIDNVVTGKIKVPGV